MISSWMKAQDRKRNLAAALSTACLYALAVGGAWVVGSLAPVSLASVPSEVVVDLAGAEGPQGAVPLGLENAPDRPEAAPPGAAPLPGPQAASSVPAIEAPATTMTTPPGATAATTAVLPAPKTAAAPKSAPKASVAKAAPTAAKAPPAAKAAVADNAAAQARAAQEDAALRAAAASAAAPPPPPRTRTFGSAAATGAGAPVASEGQGSAPGVQGGQGTVTFRGSEMGNALATTFGASSGQVGRNIYVPIYRYMPLPTTLDESIYRNIQTKETLRKYYEPSGAGWRMKNDVPVSQRDQFWAMLEAAGYDASTADFKTAAKLSPVVIEFTVGPHSDNKAADLVDVRLVSSSGSSEVDEAVLYGFRQGAFFNKTGNAVSGRFVYSF